MSIQTTRDLKLTRVERVCRPNQTHFLITFKGYWGDVVYQISHQMYQKRGIIWYIRPQEQHYNIKEKHASNALEVLIVTGRSVKEWIKNLSKDEAYLDFYTDNHWNVME